MSENNFDSLNEQQIAELYGDVLEEPIQVAGAGDYFDCTGWNILSRARDCWNRW